MASMLVSLLHGAAMSAPPPASNTGNTNSPVGPVALNDQPTDSCICTHHAVGRHLKEQAARLAAALAANTELHNAAIFTCSFAEPVVAGSGSESTGLEALRNLTADMTTKSLLSLDSMTRGHAVERLAMFCPAVGSRLVSGFPVNTSSTGVPGIDELMRCPTQWQSAGSRDSGLLAQHGTKAPWLSGAGKDRNSTCFTVRQEEIRLKALEKAATAKSWIAVIETDQLWLGHPLSMFASYDLAHCDLVLLVKAAQAPHHLQAPYPDTILTLYPPNDTCTRRPFLMLPRPPSCVTRVCHRLVKEMVVPRLGYVASINTGVILARPSQAVHRLFE